MLSRLYKKKARSWLGIDISPTSIKAVELTSINGSVHVLSAGSQLLPEQTMEGVKLIDTDEIASCLKKIIRKCRFQSQQAIIAVPDSLVITKVIQIDNQLTPLEIEEQVWFKAAQSIPYPVNETYLDYVLPNQSSTDAKCCDVLFVATRAEHVKTRAEVLTKAGLIVQAVECESQALERVLPFLYAKLPSCYADSTIAVVDIGSTHLRFYVVHAGKVLFTREEMFGSIVLLESIATHYAISKATALYWLETQQLPDNYDDFKLQRFIENLLISLKRILQFFYSTQTTRQVEHLLLTGGIAHNSALLQYLSQQTTMTAYQAQIDWQSTDSGALNWLTAGGLALKGLGNYHAN